MKICCVCNAENSSYKCPTCAQCYCSSTCWRAHKLTPCSLPAPEEIPPKDGKVSQKYEFPTEDTVPMDTLELLGQSEDIRECLKNPHVRDIARAILNDPDPTKAIALAMTEPIFVELADACLRVVEPQQNIVNQT